MQVLQNKQHTKDIYVLDLVGDFPYDQVQPGQFVNVKIGTGVEHPLRRPLSIASCNIKKETLTLVYRVVGAGTSWLSQREDGDFIDILGPLGNGFPLPTKLNSKVLVVGGGVGIPPLYQLVKEIEPLASQVDIILGFKDQSDCFWVKEFSDFGEVTVCTEDGSFGERGFVTDTFNHNQNWNYLYSCGPKPMLQALKNRFSGMEIEGFVSLEERMACGVGACSGCTVLTSDGLGTRRVCKDGPVFPWEEVVL